MSGVEGKGELGATFNRYQVSFCVDANTMDLDFGDGSTSLNILKISDCAL